MMKRNAGFTLIEVLIATAITLVVLALTASAFKSGLNANESITLLAGTNQNLQVTAYHVTQDLMKAGQDIPTNGVTYPNNAGQVVWPRPPVSPAPPATQYFFPAGLTLNALWAGDALGPLVMDTAASVTRSDVITVLYGDRSMPTPQLPVATITVNAGNTVLTVNAANVINTTAANTVRVGDLFIFQNANGTTVQEVTASAGQTLTFDTTDVLKFNQPAAAVGQGGIKTLVPNNAPAPIAPVTIQRILMVTYYIDRSTPTLPQLMRRVNGGVANPIALGIENIQFSYDSFASGVGALVNANTPANANAVRKINVFIGARSEDKSKQTNDYVRNSLQTQVAVRSLGLFDKY